MENSLRILQLSPRFPFPPDDGGKIGIFNISRELHKLGAEISLFAYEKVSPKASFLDDAKSICKPIIFEHSTDNSIFRIFKSVISNKSIYIEKHFSQKALDYIIGNFNKNEFDIIHCDHTCMAKLGVELKKYFDIPVGLRLHNIEWLIWQRYAETLPKFNIKRYYIEKQAKILKAKESELIRQVDIAFAITEPDKHRALELAPNSNIVVASAGVNLDDWSPKPIERNPHELIHATIYKWIHNINAIKWFIEGPFKKLKEKNNSISLTLLGKSAPEWLKTVDKSVNLLGYVPEVQSYLNRANIYIAPLFVGGGIRIKILEAMAMELPVVASPIAAEGIDAKAENGLFIANSADEFVEHILNLSSDFEFVRQSGKAASKFIQENYQWSKNISIMFENYKKLAK